MKWNKATAIVLSGAMVLSLTACGDGATTTTTSNKKSATESALANTLDNKVNVKSGNGDYSKEETVDFARRFLCPRKQSAKHDSIAARGDCLANIA